RRCAGPVGRAPMIVDRRLVPHLDLPLIAAVLALTCIGLATIYSVTWDFRLHRPGGGVWTQVYPLPVRLIAATVGLLRGYRSLTQRSLLIYVVLVLALVYFSFFGVVRGGARRWIPPIAGFSLQPSEFARITLALVLAMFYGECQRSAGTMGGLITGCLILA